VLFIDSVYPRPDRDSGSVTARFLIDLFLDLGWQVSFYADAEAHESSRYADALTAAGVRCLPASEIGTLESFLDGEGHGFTLAMLFRVYSGGRHYEAVRRSCPGAKIVFETVDLHFLREERQARLAGDRRALNDAYAMRERELYVARSSDLAIVVSDFEHDLLRREIPGAEVMTLPLILDCPGRRQPFSARAGVCFVGGYLHKPNIDAVEYFLADIWPRVLARLPGATFSIVGADMPASFSRFASSSVRPVGYVKDIDAFLSTVRLTVAPLRYGAGVKGKIGSSLANGVPCVATPMAVEGMKLAPGEMVAVAGDPEDFAAQVASLLQDEVAWTRMSDAAARFAVENYSLQAARARIEGMLRRLGLPAAGDALSQPGPRKGDPGRSRDGSA
jgi:glycosyltransferase involved in cell wall biosynthesis